MSRTPIGAPIRAALAAVLGLVLLSGAGGTLASWQEARTISSGVLTAGRLDLSPGPVTVAVAHTDFVAGATDITQVERTTTDITDQVGTYPLVPGDQVTVTVPMTLTLVGDNLRATLAVNPSALAGSTALVSEVNANTPPFTVTPSGGAPALTSTGTNQWAVTPASNGGTYVATMVYTVRATTDGGARTESLSTWWQATLQGTSLDARTLPFTLSQS